MPRRRAQEHAALADMKADVTKRINRAIGQLNGIKTMVEEGRYKPTNELSRPTTP